MRRSAKATKFDALNLMGLRPLFYVGANRFSSIFMVQLKKCTSEIYGRVVDDQGKRVVRFSIFCAPLAGGRGYSREFDSDDGSFRISDLSPGDYRLSISDYMNVHNAVVEKIKVIEGRNSGPLNIALAKRKY